MDYLFASESIDVQSRVFREIVEAMGGDDRVATYRDVASLAARLGQHNCPGIMVLLLDNLGDLMGVCASRDVILDADSIVLVPNGEAETYAMAHNLRPNYLGLTSGDLDKVVPVIRRLLKKRGR